MDHTPLQNFEFTPFTSYPDHGRKLLGRISGGNCRHGYGFKFMKLTGQTRCAYCDLDLVAEYENWLTMALDHVVPKSACMAWNLAVEWTEDYSNLVLCCTACNTFGNRYTPVDFSCPSTLEEFYILRDAIFIERRKNILRKQEEEHSFFATVQPELKGLRKLCL